MAIKLNDLDSANRLIEHYENNNKNMDLLKLYIAHPYICERNKFIKFINNAFINLTKNNYQEFINIISNITFTKEDKLSPLLEIHLNVLNEKLSLIDLHFKYSIEGKGYSDAKSDFMNRICSI